MDRLISMFSERSFFIQFIHYGIMHFRVCQLGCRNWTSVNSFAIINIVFSEGDRACEITMHI